MTPNSNNPMILVLNCGSSSIKFAVFNASESPLARTAIISGKVIEISSQNPAFDMNGSSPEAITLSRTEPYSDALILILARVQERLVEGKIIAVSHRVVHGGSKYSAPVVISAEILEDLRNYIPLAPLHQPFALDAIQVMLNKQPDIPQIACFDTAFHNTIPNVEKTLPLPYDAWERGLRRYGFHGLSYEYLATALPENHGDLAHGKVIAAHLGSGASLCAMQGLQSQATTMGFSALDGLMMGTRTGALDPGAVIYLMEIEKLSLDEVARILYHESGLKGVSGISSDPRQLLAAENNNPRAKLALDLYVRRAVREIGALTAVLGGLDMIVFTAGVGEHSAELRKRICKEFSWYGISINEEANNNNASLISTSESKVRVAVEPTNEEWIAASHAQNMVMQLA